jgi:hypothetical protein
MNWMTRNCMDRRTPKFSILSHNLHKTMGCVSAVEQIIEEALLRKLKLLQKAGLTR